MLLLMMIESALNRICWILLNCLRPYGTTHKKLFPNKQLSQSFQVGNSDIISNGRLETSLFLTTAACIVRIQYKLIET
jgi:hypothetical protein